MAMENWADADGDVDFNSSVLPDLAPLEELGTGMPSIEDNFLSKLPGKGPYKVFITNLRRGTRKQEILTKLRADFDIACRVDYKENSGHAVLTFQDRNDALKSKHLVNQNFLGSRINLLVTPHEQQTFQRSILRQTKAPIGGENRFRNLQDTSRQRRIVMPAGRDRLSRPQRPRKHNFPVGGSIRKTAPSVSRVERAPVQNAWGQPSHAPVSQPQTIRTSSRNDYSARDRRDPSRDFRRQNSDRRNVGGRGNFGRQNSDRRGFERRESDRGDRGGRRREDRDELENGRADGVMNWRKERSEPRRARKVPPKPDADGFREPAQPTRLLRSAESREVRPTPPKEEKKQAPKPTNKFLALLGDESDEE